MYVFGIKRTERFKHLYKFMIIMYIDKSEKVFFGDNRVKWGERIDKAFLCFTEKAEKTL